MPKENIERAIAKGAGKDAGELERVTYEAFGPGGSAMIVVALTDSRNRATQEVRHALSKRGYELGGPGSASWAFSRLPDGSYLAGEPRVSLSPEDEEALSSLLDALDELDDVEEVFTNADGYESTRQE
jgi:transcriptional/translational regulatory protein YebC/TACO1